MKRIKRLEAHKEILKTAVDIADEMFGTNIRSYVFCLLGDLQEKSVPEPH